ncbi:hypothetical protein GA0070558_15612 [Micromonospora haikouensis]|uniref:Uncharacterized protein n=1 Tax=Micromonospora haikouensis TaxID=686309 RepID=A0A1C4YM85_9ACTN|nr:hypothetical protein [Micromonospora haikouensis]SCF21873.1 hypothetical protein GA0070558_15612 [Micromonospora haikouensis]
MDDAAAFHDQLLDWVYDKANGTSTENVPIMEFAESVGLDLDGAYTLLWYCRDKGLLSDKGSGMGIPCGILTAFGIAYVREQRRRRADPALRARACRSGLLNWFYRQRIAQVHMPITGDFGKDDGSVWEGVRFTDVEIQEAAEYLSAKGLIKGIEVDQLRGPVRAEVTTDGIDCAIDWEGNVADYLRDQKGYGPTINHGPVFHGASQGGQFAWGNRDVMQQQNIADQVSPEFQPLVEAVVAILQQLPGYGLTPQDQQDIEAAANEVLAEVQQEQPEPGKLRRGVAMLKGFLFPIAKEAATEEARQLAQHGLDQVTAAIGSVL